MIFLHPQTPENFVRLILRDEFWFVQVPFIRMVKFQFLAQFPVDHLSTHSGI